MLLPYPAPQSQCSWEHSLILQASSSDFGLCKRTAWVLLLSGAVYLYPDVRDSLKEFRDGFRHGPPEL